MLKPHTADEEARLSQAYHVLVETARTVVSLAESGGASESRDETMARVEKINRVLTQTRSRALEVQRAATTLDRRRTAIANGKAVA
jgi:hypothetical protein